MGAALFHYEYMRYAFACGAIIGVLCAIVGVYVILRGMSFLTVGISHSAIGGTAIGVATGSNPEAASFAYSMLVVWLIGLLSAGNRMKLDAAIGVLFTFSQALGIYIFSCNSSFRTDLNSYLFGSIIAVGKTQLIVALIALAAIAVVLCGIYRSLNSMIFDQEFAKVCGVKVNALHYLLLILTAVAVVCSMQIVGILLVSALIVIPASSARLLCKSMRSLMTASICFGVISSVSGLVISYYTDSAPGPVIVMLSAVFFAVSWLVGRVLNK